MEQKVRHAHPLRPAEEAAEQRLDLVTNALEAGGRSEKGGEDMGPHAAVLSFGTGCSASLVDYKRDIMAIEDSLETRRKRLLWRATRRGIKEMDIIVGGFAEANLRHLGPQELDAFERILDIPDQDLLSYATRQSDIPVHLRSAMLDAVLAFRPGSPS